jgi:hypothetical protein
VYRWDLSFLYVIRILTLSRRQNSMKCSRADGSVEMLRFSIFQGLTSSQSSGYCCWLGRNLMIGMGSVSGIPEDFHISTRLYFTVLTTVTLASSNTALPDDGDGTETCRSCFNVNFNVNFKIFFKKILLRISW